MTDDELLEIYKQFYETNGEQILAVTLLAINDLAQNFSIQRLWAWFSSVIFAEYIEVKYGPEIVKRLDELIRNPFTTEDSNWLTDITNKLT